MGLPLPSLAGASRFVEFQSVELKSLAPPGISAGRSLMPQPRKSSRQIIIPSLAGASRFVEFRSVELKYLAPLGISADRSLNPRPRKSSRQIFIFLKIW